MVKAEKASTGNMIKLVIFLIFVGLTFSQFYTYARRFDFSQLLPKPANRSTVLTGTFIIGDATNQSPSGFDPAILLIALNIALWFEHPNKVERSPLIVAFIANFALMLLRVGTAAPELKLAVAATQTNIQNASNLADLYVKWNTIYFVLATISVLVVLGIIIHLLRDNQWLMAYLSRLRERFQVWRQNSVASKIKFALFLVFTLLTFYQFATFIKPVHSDASQVRNAINQITRSRPNNVDIALTVVSRFDSITPVPGLIVVLNIILWLLYPKQIGRLLFTLSLLANLSIVVIQNITEAAFLRVGGFQGMSIEARFLQLSQAENLYRILATISVLLVIAVLIQIWRKQQFRPYSQP